MRSAASRKKQDIDSVCWYVAMAYTSTSLFWITHAIFPAISLLLFLTTASAGFFGMLRAARLDKRFGLVPGITTAYVVFTILITATTAEPISNYLIAIIGLCYTVALALPTMTLWRTEFGQPVAKWLCQACGYPLFGLTEPKCPECGEAFNLADVPAAASAGQDEALN